MNVKELISQMTLEEKAGLCSGSDFWHLKGVERLGIPEIMVSDGPHGLRKQDLEADHLGINNSIKAVCFPTGAALACSFDTALIQEMGAALGEECQAEGVAVILGPGNNIKRSPLCGRNFEYFSEDPYLAGMMAGHHILGVQSQGIGTSLKHFAANSQEDRRMTADSQIDERTLREIYLTNFELAVKIGKPWTVMCSYNKVNGTYAADNHRLLTEILRDEWGFDGIVVSDWGAVNERVPGLKAGMDLEMPASGGVNDALIVQAVQDGTLDEKVLDTTVERILTLIDRYLSHKKPGASYSKEAHHQLARKIAGQCMVLLKNDGILPLDKKAKVAFIGKFAQAPRYQGGGSSHINSFRVESAMDAKGDLDVIYAPGYDTAADVVDEALIAEAVEAARTAQVAVLFVGLPDAFESEGFDRKHMDMPACQNALIDAVTAVQPNTVVVLHHGSPVTMPWADKVRGILDVYLGGQAVGAATLDVLYGDVNPSGKLAESVPYQVEDNPSYLFYPGEVDDVPYREGVFVGYRYYDAKKMPVRYPFGYGLSYTTFEYSGLTLDKKEMEDTDTLTVRVKVKNTGSRAGKETVQLYVRDCQSTMRRPDKELKGFAKVELAPGEEKEAVFTLDKRAFAYYSTRIQDWHVETGDFAILIGRSSRDIVLEDTVRVRSTRRLPVTFTMTSTVGDMLQYPEAVEMMQDILSAYKLGSNDDNADSENGTLGEGTAEMMEAMFRNMPVRSLLSFSGGTVDRAMLQEMLDKINAVLG